jgi:hypothetical protein
MTVKFLELQAPPKQTVEFSQALVILTRSPQSRNDRCLRTPSTALRAIETPAVMHATQTLTLSVVLDGGMNLAPVQA